MGHFFILRSGCNKSTTVCLLTHALNRIFKSNLSLNNFKWLLTKLELSCVRNIIPRSRKRLWNGYPFLNQELQNHDPVGRHTRIGNVWEYPPPGSTITVLFLYCDFAYILESTKCSTLVCTFIVLLCLSTGCFKSSLRFFIRLTFTNY